MTVAGLTVAATVGLGVSMSVGVAATLFAGVVGFYFLFISPVSCFKFIFLPCQKVLMFVSDARWGVL